MDVFADVMGRAGAWAGQNKYLGAIKNAFQNYMPATISGAVGVLWTNVLVNDQTGLGKLWKPIMALSVLNPIFTALQYATISCITIGVTMLVASEIAEANGETGAYPAVLGFILWLMVTPTSFAAGDLSTSLTSTKGNTISIKLADLFNTAGVKGAIASAAKSLPAGDSIGSNQTITIDNFSYQGILSNYTAATGLFTGLLVAIIGMEIYNIFRKNDHLKIKMPEQVPPGVAKAFEVLIPTCLAAIVIGAIGLVCQLATGAEVNAFIYNMVQAPMQSIIGDNIVAVMFMYLVIMLFWCVGINGNNMLSAVKEPIFRPLLYANTAVITANPAAKQSEIPYVMNLTMLSMFAEWGGSGVTLGLVAAIFLFSRREENRTIAGISLVPGLFNINETMTFGIPLVLNPILDIPFILAPIVCIFIGWILVSTGFCPKIVLEVPWTMPPVIFGYVATGAKLMGAVSQLLVFAVSFVIYLPFVLIYERQQNKQDAVD